jgi:hypothetical protein
MHKRRVLDKYIDNYKDESHSPELVLDEQQQRIYVSMLEVQDKVKGALEAKGIV